MLNQNLEFVTAPPSVKGAFVGTPQKILIRSGTRLYKWTDFPLLGPHGVTPWWSFVEQTHLLGGIVADGLHRSEELANRLGTSSRNYQRVRAAVSENFKNSMRHLLMAELISEVWAFVGKVMGQPEFADTKLDHVYLIGGSCQLWIPNLTLSHVRQVPTTS